MNNLQYLTKKTKDSINDVLDSPATHTTTKDIVCIGLTKDCVDAWKDAQLAADILKKVMDDLTG